MAFFVVKDLLITGFVSDHESQPLRPSTNRPAAALLEKLAGEPHTRLRYFCSPQHTDSALYPIISQMERAAGFVHDDTAQAKLDKLDAVLAQTLTSTQDAALRFLGDP
jgi:predicted ATPase